MIVVGDLYPLDGKMVKMADLKFGKIIGKDTTNVKTTDNEEKIFVKDWNYQTTITTLNLASIDHRQTKSTNGCISECKNLKHTKDDYEQHQKIMNEYAIVEADNRKYQSQFPGFSYK